MGTAALTAPKEVLQPASRMNKFLATIFIAAAVSAEADPYLLGYHGLGYAGYGGYAGLGYAGYGGYYGGYGSYSASAGVNIAGHAPAALPAVAGAYAGAGRYCANSAGTIHCA